MVQGFEGHVRHRFDAARQPLGQPQVRLDLGHLPPATAFGKVVQGSPSPASSIPLEPVLGV